MVKIAANINTVFAFFLPILIPFMLGAISLVLHKFKLSDMFRHDYVIRSKAIGVFVNQTIFGLFTFDMWVIISFAQNTTVSYFSKSQNFSDKYAIALFTLLLHLFTYIYTYTRENLEEFKKPSELEIEGFRKLIGRDVRYTFLFIFSFGLCCLIRI